MINKFKTQYKLNCLNLTNKNLLNAVASVCITDPIEKISVVYS